MKIECLHPTFVINPSLPQLIARYRYYVLDGRMHQSVFTYRNHYIFDRKPFREFKNKLNEDNFQNNFVVDVASGDTYPIYLLCPCNHCVLCTEKKINSFSTRMLYESFSHRYKPLFVTLTYSNEWYPKDGVSKRDIQLFLKRFRINLYRNGYVSPIRYVLCSEYGSKTMRGHYHALFYGLPLYNDFHLRRVQSILQSSWSRGFTMSREVDMSDPRTSKYTIKYLRKECPHLEGYNDVFCLSSRGHGGIGSAFIKSQADKLRKRVDHEHKILNVWSGQVQPFVWSKYALDKVYPTVCTSIPSDLRKALRMHALCYSRIAYENPELLWLYQTKKEKYDKFFGKFIYFSLGVLPYRDLPSRVQDTVEDIVYYERIIDKYCNDDFRAVLQQAQSLSDKRNLLVSKLLRGKLEPDLINQLNRIKLSRSRSRALEVL